MVQGNIYSLALMVYLIFLLEEVWFKVRYTVYPYGIPHLSTRGSMVQGKICNLALMVYLIFLLEEVWFKVIYTVWPLWFTSSFYWRKYGSR